MTLVFGSDPWMIALSTARSNRKLYPGRDFRGAFRGMLTPNSCGAGGSYRINHSNQPYRHRKGWPWIQRGLYTGIPIYYLRWCACWCARWLSWCRPYYLQQTQAFINGHLWRRSINVFCRIAIEHHIFVKFKIAGHFCGLRTLSPICTTTCIIACIPACIIAWIIARTIASMYFHKHAWSQQPLQ